MGKVRSPVLGFNTNVLHQGREFHVQTEDSGVGQPHLFTHLFHGGVILATKREEYDPAADELTVKRRMQELHKSMLRELKRGTHDEKIARYLGPAPASAPLPTPPSVPPASKAGWERDPTLPSVSVATAEPATERHEVAPSALPIEPPALAAARRSGARAIAETDGGPSPFGESLSGRHSPGREIVPEPADTIWSLRRPGSQERRFDGDAKAAPQPPPPQSPPPLAARTPPPASPPSRPSVAIPGRLPPPPKGLVRTPAALSGAAARVAGAPSGAAPAATARPSGVKGGGAPPALRPFGTPSADGAVIARPNIVVGTGGRGAAVDRRRPAAAPPAAEAPERPANIFGESQERSLDAVILAYLTNDDK